MIQLRRLLPPRHLLAVVAAILVAALLAPIASRAALPPVVVADESEFESVAKATVTLANEELVWQASLLPTVADAEQDVPFGAGFLYAGDGTIIVTRQGSERTTRLRKGTALSVEAGTRLAPVSFTGDEIEFLALELLAEDDAVEPAGDVFELAQGDYELELLRAEFPAVEVGEDRSAPVELEAGKLPILVVVVSGEVDVTAAADPEILRAGEALAVEDTATIAQASDEEVVVLAVTIRADRATGSGDSPSTTATGSGPGAGTSGAPSGGGGTGASNGGQTTSPSPRPSSTTVTEPDSDKDNDGLTAGREATLGTDPANSDTDEDEILDGDEVDQYETDPLVPDTDEDGLLDGEEVSVSYYTNPTLPDSDFDGLTDKEEARDFRCGFTNPNLADSDEDGLDDLTECTGTMTNPTSSDSDYDALYDGDEVTNGTDPLVTNDRDGDGLPDGYETPQNYGTNPDIADTDGDGLNDRQELDILTNPLVQDSDGDGLIDGAEASLGTNPLVPDSDGDGFLDGLEVNQVGTDPKNPVSHP